MAKQDVGDLGQIREQLQEWLRDKLGKGNEFTIGELNFPEASGESSVTLIFDTTLTADGGTERDKMVLRMVPKTSEVFESHDLYLQYQLMQIMTKHDVPVPGLVGYEPDKALIGSDFYVMNFVDGQIPPDQPPMAFGSWITELDDQQRATLWQNGLHTLAKIHQIPIDHYDLPSIPQAAASEPPVAEEMRKYQRLRELGIRDSADPIIDECWKLLQSTVPTDGPRRLCWGDSRPGNMIFRDLAPVAVVDWELANIADPLSDLTWYFWIDHANSVGLGTEKMGGLPEFADAYREWHELTGLPIDHTAWYELFVMWRYAVILEKKMMAMMKVDSNFADFPNHGAAMIAPLMAALR